MTSMDLHDQTTFSQRATGLRDRARRLRAVPSIAIALIAIFVVHRLSAEVRLDELSREIATTPAGTFAIAVLLTALSFAAMGSFDVLAVRSAAPGRIPWRVAATTGAASYAISNLLGFPWLTGGAVRYRIYAQYGLDFGAIAGITATTWSALFLGLASLFGGLLLLQPAGLPESLGFAQGGEVFLGAAIIAAIALLYLALAGGRKIIPLGSSAIPLPGAGATLGLNAVGVFDLATAALALYVLLPADLDIGFGAFFVLYIAALGLGVFSQAPGGFGVFEATLIAGLGAAGRPDVLAALLVYRAVYTALPFAVAAFGLAAIWILARRAKVGTASAAAFRLVRPFVPFVTAGVAFLSGAVLMLSGNLPSEGERLAILRDVVPLPVVEVSHLAGSVAGVLLVVVARGLYLRLRRAWTVTMGLLCVGLAASLAKGLDWEEALTLFMSLSLLWIFRSAFYRAGGGSIFRLNLRWIAPSGLLIAAIAWVGFAVHADVAYSDELWWRVAWGGDASRFLRALLAVAVVLAAVLLNAIIAGFRRPMPAEAAPSAVRRLVAVAPDSQAGIWLSGDKRFLVSDDGRAALAYADTGAAFVAKGDPLGDPDAATELLWRFRELADGMGRRTAFYAVSAAYLPACLELGLKLVKLGEVARVDLPAFSLAGPKRKGLRYASARAQRDGLVFEVVPSERVGLHIDDLRRVSDAWLAHKNRREKSFALGAFDPVYLQNFDHAILRDAETRRIVAFATLLQSGGKHELSVDLMRHLPDAPKIAMEALFVEMIVWGKAQGFRWFSLGAAPLAGIERRPLAPLWAQLGGFLYEHGGRFYGFEGLRAFKDKFDPVWSPHYLACGGGLDVARTLYDVNKLVSGGLRGAMGKSSAPRGFLPRRDPSRRGRPRLSRGVRQIV